MLSRGNGTDFDFSHLPQLPKSWERRRGGGEEQHSIRVASWRILTLCLPAPTLSRQPNSITFQGKNLQKSTLGAQRHPFVQWELFFPREMAFAGCCKILHFREVPSLQAVALPRPFHAVVLPSNIVACLILQKSPLCAVESLHSNNVLLMSPFKQQLSPLWYYSVWSYGSHQDSSRLCLCLFQSMR